MTSLLDNHRSEIDALARQSGFTPDAIASMWRSVVGGNGRMAQFEHPEFGGAGQWMRGGMLMIADFSNHDLKQRIERLCDAIAERLSIERPSSFGESFQSQSQSAGGRTFVQDSRVGHSWWPAAFGSPETSGVQNDMRYAWFSGARRLAIDEGGTTTVYDTGNHRIAGVSQQQGGHRTLAFTSQHGLVDLASLPVVDASQNEAVSRPDVAHDAAATTMQGATSDSSADPFVSLEKLAALHARGILADDEFAKKKAELLARI